ncbi:MAG: HTTM domain-containing protein [Planctomycetaceae bacterium]|nr:HTTM domain-containing protein [Planctomycetaceae bacterium]
MSTATNSTNSRQETLATKPVAELLDEMLYTPISARPLIYFRIILGLLLFKNVFSYIYEGKIEKYFLAPAANFNFPLFPWVQAWPGNGMYWHYGLLCVAAVCFILGLGFRYASAIYCLGFLYAFLIERALYLNHHYVVILLTFVMTFMPANRMLSLDTKFGFVKRMEYIPSWSLWVLRIQIGIVYFYGGVVKINEDWLSGVPMKFTASKLVHMAGLPIDWQNGIAYFLVYTGMIYDLLVFPFLLHKKLRWIALLASLVFHLTNSVIFHIGIFPWMMIGATFLLFFNDLLPRLPGEMKSPSPEQKKEGVQAVVSLLTPQRKRMIKVFFLVFVAYQVLMPLRSYLYSGNPGWTQNGDHFSWRMMLNRRIPISFEMRGSGVKDGQVVDLEFNKSWESGAYKNHWQLHKMTTAPDMILQFVHLNAENVRKQGFTDVAIYVDSQVSLNGRPPQPLVNPNVNLANEKRHILRSYDWVLPLDPLLKSPRLEDFPVDESLGREIVD